MSLTIFRISKSRFQRKRKKIPLLVRTFRSDLSTGWKAIFIYLQKKLLFSYPVQKISFQMVAGEKAVLSTIFPQMVAGETKLFMRASSAIFQNVSSSGSRRDLRFGECPQKKSLPVVADEKGIFRSVSRKIQKIILPKLDRIFKINFPTTCRE